MPEVEPYVAGVVRGKKWEPPAQSAEQRDADEKIAIDMGDEYEQALTDATQEEIIDLAGSITMPICPSLFVWCTKCVSLVVRAAILGFHSMMNQDQYHASLLNKGQPIGLGWDGITKHQSQKVYPQDPPNNTDVEDSIKRVKDDDPKLIELNLNNIKVRRRRLRLPCFFFF